MPRRFLLLALPLLALPSLTAGAATTGTLTFGPNVTAYSGSYGEPGLSIVGQNVYATTPGEGGAVWGVSRNGGLTWEKKPTVKPPASETHGAAPGSDSDVAVGPDGNVYVGDLTIDGIEVSRSTDGGNTFTRQTFVNTDLTADREWLAVDGRGDEAIVYVAWHELATGTMLLKRSTNGGLTYDDVPTPLYSQAGTVGESARNGTSIGQITTDGKGHVYISYGVSRIDTTPGTTLVPISKIIVASSADYGKTWKDVVVNPGYADANYGNFWMASAVDTGGTVYAVYSGFDHVGERNKVYLQASADFGTTWSAPYVVSPPEGHSLFGWVAGGGPGVAVAAWYHTDSADKDANGIEWTTQVAQVRGLAAGTPTAVYRGTASDHVMHTGGICTYGILCGVVPGTSDDRTLLDFFKVTVAPDGMAAVVFSDNGDGRRDVTFAKQNGGPSAFAVSAPATGGTGTTGGTGSGGTGGSGSGGTHIPTTGLGGLGATGVVAAGAVLLGAGALLRRRRTARG